MKPSESTMLALLRSGCTGTIRSFVKETELSHNGVQRALWFLEEEGLALRIEVEEREGNGARGTVWACTGPGRQITVTTPAVAPGLSIVQSALFSRLPLDLWAAER